MASNDPNPADSNIKPEGQQQPYVPTIHNSALKDLLHQRLEDCGWRDDIRNIIRTILDRRGVNNVSYEEIAAEVIPKARALVPADVRLELQMLVRQALHPTNNNISE